MRVHILSDLHLEFADFAPPQTNADVVVLAGDIHTGVKGIRWAKERFPSVLVIYVLGNHEYYGHAYPRLLEKAKAEAAGSLVKVLEDETLAVDGVCFLGSTYWTDFELLGDPRIAGYEATQKMTDYRRIRVSPAYRKLRSLDTSVANRRSNSWLKNTLDNLDGEVPVIITHHAPSALSLPDWYREDLVSAAYASHHDSFVMESGAALWIHGHVHRPSDYMVGQTRVVCNPRGYPDEPVSGFVQDFVVEVAEHA